MSESRRDKAAAALQEIDKLIDAFDIAMLVTESLQGQLRARPMQIAGHDPGAVLYFLTRSDDEKLQEVLRRDGVVAAMSADAQYVSISGKARLKTDRVLIDRFWSANDRLWFREGPEDPDITLLVVEPTYAECWDRSGVKGLELWWEAGRALIDGRKANDQGLAGHHVARIGDDAD